MRTHPGRLCVLLLLTCAALLTLNWVKTDRRDAGSTASSVLPDLQELHKHLQVTEELGREVTRNLSSILEQLVYMSRENAYRRAASTKIPPWGVTGGLARPVYQEPNIFVYMPHLRQHQNSLLPNVLLGRGRDGVSIVLGVPTVKRDKQSYLVSTLESLLYNLSPSQKQDLLIIVFVAEVDPEYVSSIAETINTTFPRDVQSGLLEVVSPPQNYYPDFSVLTESLGDPKDRVKWRTKQNLDFSFLMLYAHRRGTFYVQLEDDVVAKEGYYTLMKTYALREQHKPWLFVEFSQLGFIGKMFRGRELPMIAEFFLMFHRDKPVDWLLDHILWVKVCHPEKDSKDCTKQKSQLKQRYRPSLFQHVGFHSSLSGKMQPLKDKDFGKQVLFRPHLNPGAELLSSLKHHQQHSLERAYRGLDFFWALTPLQGDYVLIKFPQPIHISGFLFRSGNIANQGDKFFNTTVEALPGNVEKQNKESDGFKVVGAFVDGVAEVEMEEALQPISALRLVVHSNADSWAVLSEIHVRV